VSHCRRRQHGSPTENRHGGAPRGVPVAPGQVRASLARASRLASATERKSAPVGAPPAPHQGPDRPLSSRRWAQARRSVSQAGGDAATSEGTKRQGKATTRTRICAAGTRSAARHRPRSGLFDIVKKDDGKGGPHPQPGLCNCARARALMSGRHMTHGTGSREFQGRIGNFRSQCPRVSCAPDAVLGWDVST